MLYTSATALLLLSSLSPFVAADPAPRPPGPPPALNYDTLGSLAITPKAALDADARAVNLVSSALLGPSARPPRPDETLSTSGYIQISDSSTGSINWLGDGSLDGDAVWSNVVDQAIASKSIAPAKTCASLPSLFSLYGILSQYAPLPYVGLSTFTGKVGADTTLSAGGAGYAFIAPTNQTAAKTYATAATSLGSPYGGESAVWSLNCATKELKANWTLADGSQLPLTFVQWSVDGIVATGNYTAFKAAFPAASAPLTFIYVPTNTTNFYSTRAPLNPKRIKTNLIGGAIVGRH